MNWTVILIFMQDFENFFSSVKPNTERKHWPNQLMKELQSRNILASDKESKKLWSKKYGYDQVEVPHELTDGEGNRGAVALLEFLIF